MFPDAGDVGWVEFGPTLGSEQSGRRPGLILSSTLYHQDSDRALVCPITSWAKPWPFNVVLPEGLKVAGVVLVDQVRMIHRPSRLFSMITTVPPPVLAEVRGRLAALVGVKV